MDPLADADFDPEPDRIGDAIAAAVISGTHALRHEWLADRLADPDWLEPRVRGRLRGLEPE